MTNDLTVLGNGNIKVENVHKYISKFTPAIFALSCTQAYSLICVSRKLIFFGADFVCIIFFGYLFTCGFVLYL